jgi:hypothetical protein
MGATLSLGRKDPVPSKLPEHGPEFNQTGHYAEVCGMDGVKFVQGKALFNHIKRYVGPAPENMWLAPLTAEQERERQRKIIANKKFFGTALGSQPGTAKAELPKDIRDAQQENRKALAAESRAA